ncbi:autotransporter assembly complex protein TamA [Halothiobacillus sp. DCM-1]|uniref:autotransporter assembly complex protein TamA n=1 Tax=Halothiobacillus sp. DCM-1 TaxID=3112558 RepID=UPI0032552337
MIWRRWVELRALLGAVLGLLSFAAAQASSAPPPALQLQGLTDPILVRQIGLSVPVQRFACDAPPLVFERYLTDATADARRALQALGYFHAELSPSLETQAGCTVPVLRVVPGERVRWAVAQIEVQDASGKSLRDQPFLRDFLQANTPAPDSPMDQGQYARLRDGLLERARGAGYLHAQWRRHVLRVDPATNRATIELSLDAGRRARFGAIEIEQSLLSPELASRLAGVQPGDHYTTANLVAINQNLMSPRYFSSVRVRPPLDQPTGDVVPVRVQAISGSPRSYEFKIGYGTDTGPRLGAVLHQWVVNPAGHQWRANLSLAQRQQTLSAAYTIPRLADPLNQRYELYSALDRENNLGITSLSMTNGAQWVRNFNRWNTALFTEYLLERSQFGDEPAMTNGFWLTGARVGWRELNDPLFPTRGLAFNASLSGAAKPLLSSASLLRARVQLAGMWPISDDWVWLGRTEVGGVLTDALTNLPKTLRFFAGGDQSVRGYGYQSLGPVDATGQPVGGRYVFTASTELMHPVYGRDWWGAVFVDTGNAFDSLADFSLATGAGVGLRWRSPVGVVRVDVAYPFDGSRRLPRLHLGIGVAF